MGKTFSLTYESKGMFHAKEVAIPKSAECIKCSNAPRDYGKKFGTKLIYTVGTKKRERVVPLPRDAEDVTLEL